MQNKKRIPVSENVAYTHWEMPDLTGVKRRIAQRLSELQEQEVSEAEAAAAEPVLPSQEEVDALKEQARQEGYAAGFTEGSLAGKEDGRALGYQEGEQTGQEAGFQAGYQRGLDQAEQEVDQQLARLQSLIVQLQGPLAALDHEVEGALLSLVDLVCRAILRREIKIERSFLSEVIQEAVAALPAGHQRLRIFLNPEDLNLAEAACQDLLEDYRLVGDPEVTLGGVKIETLQSLVDSTLENRYKKIIEKLLGSAYQSTASNFEPLPEQVLATPDATPLAETTFSEPTATETQQPESLDKANLENATSSELEDTAVSEQPMPEPVAQVSLQRGKAPRHEQPLASAPKEETEAEAPQAEEATETKVEPQIETAVNESIDEPFEQVQDEATENEATNHPATSELATDELFAEETAAEDLAPESLESNAEKVDDFLDEFAADDAETEFEALLAESASGTAASDAEVKAEPAEADAILEEAEWAPESVHDDRYLENVLESTWLDDLQEPEGDEPLDAPSAEKPSD